MSLTTMDKKYRDALPAIIRDLPFEKFSDHEGASTLAAHKKKARKCKKTKIGKNGLYSGEEVDIARWWTCREKSDHVCDSKDAHENAMKATLLDQRARETQMQIILVLETLALEACVTDVAPRPTVAEESPKQDESSQNKPKKLKKPQDLNTLLDLLADRLCIWQSMNTDQTKISGDDSQPSGECEIKLSKGSTQNECLRGFCIDVILPL